jgi:hypothetical protein
LLKVSINDQQSATATGSRSESSTDPAPICILRPLSGKRQEKRVSLYGDEGKTFFNFPFTSTAGSGGTRESSYSESIPSTIKALAKAAPVKVFPHCRQNSNRFILSSNNQDTKLFSKRRKKHRRLRSVLPVYVQYIFSSRTPTNSRVLSSMVIIVFLQELSRAKHQSFTYWVKPANNDANRNICKLSNTALKLA